MNRIFKCSALNPLVPLALLWALCLPGAEVKTGTLHGFVRDAAEYAVPGVTVSIKTGSTLYKTKTDADGKYRIDLDEGKYSVQVKDAQGFLPSKVIRTEVAAGITTRCDIDLFVQEPQPPEPAPTLVPPKKYDIQHINSAN